MSHLPLEKKGFTLIELMIVIAIIAILSVGTYVPYNYYSQLSRVRLSADIVGQSLNDAKIMSMNGFVFPDSASNADIGLVLQEHSSEIRLFAYQSGAISSKETAQTKMIRTIPLEDQIQFSHLPEQTVLLRYEAPSGKVNFYRENGTELTETGIDLTIGLKGAMTWPLSHKLSIQK